MCYEREAAEYQNEADRREAMQAVKAFSATTEISSESPKVTGSKPLAATPGREDYVRLCCR